MLRCRLGQCYCCTAMFLSLSLIGLMVVNTGITRDGLAISWLKPSDGQDFQNFSASGNCTEPIIGVLRTSSKTSDALLIALCERYSFPMIVVLDGTGDGVVDHSPKTVEHCNHIQVISTLHQRQLSKQRSPLGRFISALPWNHPARKNVGYLLAIQLGACTIWDFDENYTLLKPDPPSFSILTPISGKVFGFRPAARFQRLVNPYPLFSPTSWFLPRGLPFKDSKKTPRESAGELIRMDRYVVDTVVVIQSIASEYPDASAIYGQSAQKISFFSRVPFVVLDHPSISPYNSMSSLHHIDAFWALYLPSTPPNRVADLYRTYLSQTIFRILGKRIAFSSPWVRANKMHDEDNAVIVEADFFHRMVFEQLETWAVNRQGGCAAELVQELYATIWESNDHDKTELSILSLWFDAFRFVTSSPLLCTPSSSATTTTTTFSHSPQTLLASALFRNVHTAVHINHNQWAAIGPWHAIFGAQYGSVSFHVQLNHEGTSPASPFSECTYFRSFTRPLISGDDSYNTLLELLQHVPEAASKDIILWQHDDSFIHPSFLRAWQHDTHCAAICPVKSLPSTDLWHNSSRAWWHRDIQNRAAASVILSHLPLRCNTTSKAALKSIFHYGQSDAMLLRRKCPQVQSFVEYLRWFSFAGLYLEIALPTAAFCSFQNSKSLSAFPLYTTWDGRRRDLNDVVKKLKTDGARYGQYHPVKLSSPDAIMKIVEMRDVSMIQFMQKQSAAVK